MGGSAAFAGMGRPTSGNARYIGRVGGLAFALGIGAAVLTGTAVASADAGDAGSGASATSASSSESSSSPQSGTTRGPAASGSASASEPESTGESATASEDSDEVEADETEVDETEAAETEVDETEVELDEVEAEVEAEIADVPDARPVSRSDNTDAAPSAQRLTAATEPDATTSALVAAEPPAPTFAGWVESLFDNKTPTLGYNPADNEVIEGRIEGDLRAEDADSTRLTYTTTKPAHGTVKINSDGTFVYTPGASYTGQDRFDVTVSDARSGLHIHGFAGLLNLVSFGLLGSSGHRTTETVFIGFERAVVVSGLNSPVDFRFLEDGRIIVAEKGGAIRIVENGTLRDQSLIQLSVSTLGERGISGLAVDPDFDNNGHIYVAYTTTALLNTLSRFTVDGNSAGSELILLQATQSSAVNHHGGALGFGPDGKLYWGVGDNANSSNSQNLSNIHGKILRLNPDGTTPSDNPELGSGALAQIYAYGLRNPFRLTFTPDGKLLVADVGAAAWEELNLVTAGGNYGWPNEEGVCTSGCGDAINPIYTYPRGNGAAITSVLVYNGDTFGDDYVNKVFIADTVQGWIRVLTCTPDFTSCGDAQDFDPQAGATIVLSQGPDGNLYQLTYSPGTLVRISPAGDTAAELV